MRNKGGRKVACVAVGSNMNHVEHEDDCGFQDTIANEEVKMQQRHLEGKEGREP